MASMNISLPDQMKSFVAEQVATGRYANASDYVRDLIRERQDHSDRFWALVEEGEASGVSDKTVRQAFAEARAEFLKG